MSAQCSCIGSGFNHWLFATLCTSYTLLEYVNASVQQSVIVILLFGYSPTNRVGAEI